MTASATAGGPGPGPGPGSVVRAGGPDSTLADAEVQAFVAECLGGARIDGRSVCVVVPDGTRTCPLPMLLQAVHGALCRRASRVTVLVALGTHSPMGDAALRAHVGGSLGGGDSALPHRPRYRLRGDGGGAPAGADVATGLGARCTEMVVDNHRWWEPATFTELGTITAGRVAELSEGRIRQAVPVRVNRAVVEHDLTLIVGPVLPHEVVGFSGGDKYLFPGLSGGDMVDVSHWLGALLTSSAVIGVQGTTPVRALIDEAAAMVPSERLALCVVPAAGGQSLCSISFGHPPAAWSAAAEVSARTHVRWLDRPVRRVLAVLPTRYDDLWTGAKGFYKVEPVVADGGEVVLYAPHITEISRTHPAVAEIGYHCRDYFLGQWERFADRPWADLAHSTHLRGAGSWDPGDGERCRLTVTLATAIPEATVRSVGLRHLDPAAVDVDRWAADTGTLVVADAGEHLYRLAPPQPAPGQAVR